MKTKYILGIALAVALGMSSCTEVSDDHDAFKGIGSDPEEVAARYASAFTYDNGSNHSNKITVINNSGYACRLDYMVGTTMLNCGTENKVEVVVPFAGELTFTATMLYDGEFVPVQIPVRVDDIDTPIDPLMQCLTAGTAEGRTWEWWADGNGGGYIEGSWGCVGGGGYGWSATGPNWIFVDGQYSWYLDIPVAYFDVAMLDDEHLILIAPGGGGAHTICDDSWAISSTHWTFQVRK